VHIAAQNDHAPVLRPVDEVIQALPCRRVVAPRFGVEEGLDKCAEMVHNLQEKLPDLDKKGNSHERRRSRSKLHPLTQDRPATSNNTGVRFSCACQRVVELR
jgi:hypothetical protein